MTPPTAAAAIRDPFAGSDAVRDENMKTVEDVMTTPGAEHSSRQAPLRARGLTVRRGRREILRDVDLDVHLGEVLALVGPNGAGKSTLLAALVGDLPPARGSVQLDGCDITGVEAGALARRRAVLTQHNQVSFPFTVRQIVRMGRAPWHTRDAPGSCDPAAEDELVDACLRECDVLHLADRQHHELSGGERARVSLARVLAQDTELLFLDEPTAALDLRHQEDVAALALARAQRGVGVVVVVHDLALADAMADRVAVVAAGGLRAIGTPAEVLTEPLLSEVYGCAVRVVDDGRGRRLIGISTPLR